MTRPVANLGEVIILARHNKSRAAWLRLRAACAGERVELLEVLPAAGPLPDCADLLGVGYASPRRALDAVLERLRSPRRDVIDRIELTDAAARGFDAFGEAHLRAALPPGSTPPVQAEPQADGTLLLYVEHDGVRLAGVRVPAGHWAWRT